MKESREGVMHEVLKHFTVVYNFASRCGERAFPS